MATYAPLPDQAEPEDIFPERIFTYLLRIFDYFHQPPISLVILCDSDPKWRPDRYGFTTFGSSLQFNFTAVKLLDYAEQWEELEASQNIFATVVMTHLKAQETKRNVVRRKEWKLRLIQGLYEQGYDRSAILNLFTFIDWIMILPEAAKVSFWQELKVYEEQRQMPYITSVEQIGYDRGQSVGYDRGIQVGLENALDSIALKMIRENMPLEIISRVTGLPITQIQQLQVQPEQD